MQNPTVWKSTLVFMFITVPRPQLIKEIYSQVRHSDLVLVLKHEHLFVSELIILYLLIRAVITLPLPPGPSAEVGV